MWVMIFRKGFQKTLKFFFKALSLHFFASGLIDV